MRQSFVSKFVAKLFRILPYIMLGIIAVPILGISYTESTKLLGLRTVSVPVEGTGSMYPSLFWAKSEGGPEDDTKSVIEEYRSTPHLYSRFAGFHLFGHILFRRSIGHGDLVAFQNSKTKEILRSENKDEKAGFIKRIIAIPGDTIELKDGFVYLNGDLLSEPYISLPRSTYGGDILPDCKKLHIPAGKYFVLGDNRKVSSDSRYTLGLIDDQDIQFLLPYSEQQIYHSLYRNTSKDDELIGQPTLSTTEFIDLVNKARSSKKIGGLTSSPLLIKSATLRGEKLLSDPQTSYDLKKSLSTAGYSNIVLGEFVSRGHFSAKELLENLLYNTSSAKQILNKDFTDIGVAAVNENIDGCPTQIIVGHLGGYVPADYDQGTINSWQSLLDNLNTVIPSWEKAMSYDGIDKTKLGTLLTILYRRQNLSKDILSTMQKRAWLSDAQQQGIKSDAGDSKQAEDLITQLNKQ